ncbi:MAG: single-stranded-DNA-specific exonuclease RecJ [Anaerolineaceae bacterium]|nr:single-stranded-DNA-specific exonuclease RecJ [Anaerolineaceae bacterium]
MKTWLDPQPVSVPDDLRAAVGGHSIVAETLVRRGISQPEAALRFLDPDHYTPASPYDLPDMEKAVARVRQAIREQVTILVWGDFDVDGQTSTALLVSALRELGAQVEYHVPNRFTEGHGIHLPTLTRYLDAGIGLLLTCDTGIAAHDAVDLAQGHGVDVVITDHHSLPPELPNAYAAVNPMRLPEGHPLRELPGVGTAYMLVRALYDDMPSEGLLDLVAMGIVADVMVQVDDTRYWLQRGLERLRTAARPGLQAMMTRAEVDPAYMTEMDIGFRLGPRLNALGRLEDAGPAVQLLTTDEPSIIEERVNELEGLNQKRRFLTRQVYEAAQRQIEQDPSLLKYAVLVVCGEGWHTGVVGIVASRLVEDYGCPVIVLAENEGVASGSARSVEGANIVEAIRSQADLLNSFGGHNMAAGLSLPTENIFAFRRGISQTVRGMLGTEEVAPEIAIDAYLDLGDISLELAEDIARLAPFGNGNPPLVLATRDVHIKSRRNLGRRGDHIELKLADADGNEQRVVWWFGDMESLPQGRFDIAYTLRANAFNGKREALVEWLDARPITEGITLETGPRYEVVDYRGKAVEDSLLADLRQQFPGALVLYEGMNRAIEGVDRYSLSQAETLVVWSVPPGPDTWQAILNEVQPQRLVLVGKEQPETDIRQLFGVLGGLAKYALTHYGGRINMQAMVARTGHDDWTIRQALKALSARVDLSFVAISEDDFQVVDGGTANGSTELTRLQSLLRESQAYAKFWLRQAFE